MEEPKKTERIEEMRILDEMKNSYMNYAMSVIVSRALPDVRDGLKPSQRRIMVAMNDLNLGPRSKHRKCAKIVGDTGGNYHPHGDQATYGTLVRLGQDWNMRHCLVDPQGNFGSIDNDPPAAMRYTEARMSAEAMEMLEDLNRDTVDFVANYDETRTEPTVLPSRFPNLIVNGSTGIAVGMATNLAPHNLGEVCEALLMVIKDPNCGFKDIMKVLPGPDFPTGGIICGRSGIRQAFSTGKGHLTVRGKVDIEEHKKDRKSIIITEIPYMIVKTAIVSKVAELVEAGTLTEVSDVRDESDRNGMRIVVELKRDAEEQIVLNKLYQYTPLQSTFAISNVALVNNRPETLNIKQLLQLFIDHRKEVIRRRSRFLLAKCRNRAHILEGLILAVSDIDEIINLIKKSPDAPTAKLNLMKKPLRLAESATLRKLLPAKGQAEFVKRASSEDQFLTGPQADAILSMQLSRLTGLEIEKLGQEYAALVEEISGYEAILASEKLVLDIITEDLYELKEKYADKRRTVIAEETEDIDIEDLIADEQALVTVSHSGYVKRMPVDTYRKQGRGGKGVIGSDTKEGDFIESLFTASTHDYLMVFTNRGKCYWLKVYNIPQLSRQSKGRSIANLLNLGDQKVTSIINVDKFDERNIVMATRDGTIKKSPLGLYANPRASGIIAIKLEPSDDLIGVALTSGKNHIILGTKDGMAIRFDESQARPMGRGAHGVRGIKLRKGDCVVDMVIAEEAATEGQAPSTGSTSSPQAGSGQAALLTICENGHGKRTTLEDYRAQGRGGIGLINIKTSERNGSVVALKAVRDEDDIMIMTANGIIIRTGLEEIREIGRNTQGVRLIKLEENDKVVAVERVVKEEKDEGTSSDVPPEQQQEPDEAAEEPPVQDEENT
ncbi:MAG: DNA gyrase subunit A [Phycisphaerae bacterium]|nr:DNA gyrase subunit A [Phycisphaerae bacterium]